MVIPKKVCFAIVCGVVATGAAQADHNSPWGEGWANMPNDIHNTRVETRNADNDDFIDFVKTGAGADSVNRFSDDDTDSATGAGDRTRGSVRRSGGR